MRSRADLAAVAEDALRRADRLAEQSDRLARVADRMPGLLVIHFPKAQPPFDLAGSPPTVWCGECTQPYPCRTIQYVYQFGEFAAIEADSAAADD